MKRKTGSKVIALLIIAGLFLLCSCSGISETDTRYYHVLMYHSLCEDESGVNGETVTAAKFREDMQWLVDNGYTALFPSELLSMDEVPEKCVMITFDDGYKSNYTLAYPILKELGLKAEISLITSCVDNSDTYTGFMNWDEVRELSESGLIEIGSHTHNLHNPENGGRMYEGEKNGIMRASSRKAIKEDLETSRNLIEEHTGIRPVVFSYPYGAAGSRWDKKAVDGIFPVSFGTVPGEAKLSIKVRIPRYRIDQNTSLESVLD